jgi:predicted nucleic acid-binding protein
MALSWHFSDEHSEFTASILRRLSAERAIVPALWPTEVANGLLVAERRGRIKSAELAAAVRRTLDLPIDIRQLSLASALGSISELARAHGLTVYDATYLHLALEEGLPLATLDDDLIAAARRVGLPELA